MELSELFSLEGMVVSLPGEFNIIEEIGIIGI